MAKPDRKNIRVDFQKNRANRARKNDVTRDVRAADESVDELASAERVSGRGDLTRRRTIAGATLRGDQIILDVDESKCLKGRVTAAIGATQCLVQTEDGRDWECTVRRVVRTVARDARNAVVTGDRVLILPEDAAHAVVERVEPREGVIARGHQYRQHILVANVTHVLIVGSADLPPLKPALIDRFLVSAGKGDVKAIVCINKVDLVDVGEMQAIVGLYSQLGYETVLTSTVTGYGIPYLRMLLKDRQTVFAGQSGVGKSSLFNAVQPGLGLQTGSISEVSQKGRHTTRYARLLKLEFGGWVVDTPGVRQMELWGVSREEMEAYFVEFRPFVTLCKFPNCLHITEKDCAVRRAAQVDLISRLRYESYLRLVMGDE